LLKSSISFARNIIFTTTKRSRSSQQSQSPERWQRFWEIAIKKTNIKKPNMKIKYFLPLLILTSCNLIDNNPKCSDEEVKKLALEIFKEKVEKDLKDNFINEKLNTNDLYQYAKANERDYDEVIEEEKEKLKNEAEIYAIKVFNEVRLENILTTKLEKEIKKCECEAEIKSKYLNEIKAYYSAQYNDEGQTYVEFLYELKNK
jgi:hypothetical protein